MKEESKNDSIFNNRHTPMLIIDSETGEIRDGNPAACSYYGYDRDKLLKLNISDINTLDQEQIHEEMEKAKREDRKYFRFKHKLSNGEIKDVEVYSGPIFINGEFLLFSIIHDVEDKREMERKLKVQETYFESLYENSPEGIAILDNDYRIININNSFERIFQYSLDEIRHKSITEVICEKKFYDESTYFKDSINRGEFVRKETVRRRKDGTLVDISFLGYPVISNGCQIGVYGVYEDISKIKEEKKKYEEQLKKAKLKAEVDSKFKSQFIANMTHEIRTPMNGIVGIIELLEDTQHTNEQKEYIRLLRYSANRLSSLINNVLDISKIEAGKLELRNVRFSIKSLLNDVARYYKIQAGRKGLDLNCSIDQGLPDFLIGDPDKLIQVLLNLLSNAVKFTETGHVDIDVKVVKKAENKVSIRFSISDTGIGIPKEKIRRIFEDFYQLETVKNRKYGGTGLGLSISRKLVQLIGSDIMVESGLGKGSTFSFTAEFPVPELQDNSEGKREDSSKISMDIHPVLNILVVEDESVNQKILKNLLEKNKYNVTVAENGEEALRVLEKRSFDVILMDIYMPEMNGYETAKLIRKRETSTGHYTPIIAITAAVQEGDREKYLEVGIDCCIAKPAGRDQICSAIAEVLKNRNKPMVVCLESLVERFEGDHELLKDIIAEVTSSEYEKEFFGGLETYIKNRDFEKMSNHIHRFKGSISYFHADSINSVLYGIKECCKNQDLPAIEKLFQKLELEYARLKECLMKYRADKK